MNVIDLDEPDLSDYNERFVQIGEDDDTYYFSHNIFDGDYDTPKTYQIYNVLIHEKIITNASKRVVVYEFDDDIDKPNVYIIAHSDVFKQYNKYAKATKDHLSKIYNQMINKLPATPILSVYANERKCFISGRSTPALVDADIIRTSITINFIKYVVTNKPIVC